MIGHAVEVAISALCQAGNRLDAVLVVAVAVGGAESASAAKIVQADRQWRTLSFLLSQF